MVSERSLIGITEILSDNGADSVSRINVSLFSTKLVTNEMDSDNEAPIFLV